MVGGVEHVDPAPVRRVRVEHLSTLVLEEDARSLPVRHSRGQGSVVEDGRVPCLRRERDAEVVVEVALEGRDPVEGPPHALPVAGELGERRPRDGDHRHVPGVQVDDVPVEAVGPERAVGAARVVFRVEHEVVDDQLAAPVEQLGECLLPARPVEDVILGDLLPRKLAPLAAQLVAEPRELLLSGQQGRARVEPRVVPDDLVILSQGTSSTVRACSANRL